MNMDILAMIFGMTKGRYSPSMPSMPEGDMADIQDGFDRASILQKCQGINSCTKEMRDRKEYKEAKEYLESHPEELANYLHMPTKADKVDTLFLDGFERWAGYYAALDITQPKNT